MKAPAAATTQPGNHGRQAGSICKKPRPQQPKPCKYEYFTQPKTYSGSEAWEFFTDDYSMDLRERVVAAVADEGLSRRQAAARFGVSDSTAINLAEARCEDG